MSAILDPFNLALLAEDIDRNIVRTIAREFQGVVSEDALVELKTKLRNEASTVIVEFWNDLLELQQKLGTSLVRGPQSRVPTPLELAAALPRIYGELTEQPPGKSDQLKDHRMEQLRWVASTWLQVCGAMMQRLSPEWPVSLQGTLDFSVPEEAINIPKTDEIDTIADNWQMLRRLTLEYLQQKAELLQALGEDVPSVHIALDSQRGRIFIDARKAFWRNEYYAGTLMVQAMRSVLIDALALNQDDLRLDLTMLPSTQIVVLAAAAGLSLPYPVQILGNIVHDLDRYQDENRILPMAMLYPLFRIMDDAITKIKALPADASCHKRAIAILNKHVGSNADDRTNQSNHQ